VVHVFAHILDISVEVKNICFFGSLMGWAKLSLVSSWTLTHTSCRCVVKTDNVDRVIEYPSLRTRLKHSGTSALGVGVC